MKLFTIVYAPRDTTRRYPLLMTRTAYGIAPYGANEYRTVLGPNNEFAKEGYIFVQSSRFPMFDRNPQTFVDIYHAKDGDYQNEPNLLRTEPTTRNGSDDRASGAGRSTEIASDDHSNLVTGSRQTAQ